jgi:multisubunit Na+/H+ antiporter MnhC subunit
MPLETALILFAIVIPFAIFAAVLAWADSRTRS